jgi:hypothetical protein
MKGMHFQAFAATGIFRPAEGVGDQPARAMAPVGATQPVMCLTGKDKYGSPVIETKRQEER